MTDNQQLIPYIGDVSKNDALVLKEMAETHERIMEFGVGASTQILGHYAKDNCLYSIDTSEEWMEKTLHNINLLGIAKETAFLMTEYYQSMETFSTPSHECTYDFIFDDGVDHLRREFAIKIWPYLEVGGVLAFHDTRRAPDFRNVLEVLAHYQDEVGRVEFNYKSSNITLVWKKEPEPYSNWQIDECKEPWMLGYGDPPQEFIESLKQE